MTATVLDPPVTHPQHDHADQTAADLLAVSKDSSHRYELIAGNLLTLPLPDANHGAIALTVGAALHTFGEDHRAGCAFGAGTGFLLARNPDTVRAPDAAFVSQARLPETGLPADYFPGAPDLAVEVVSPGDTAGEVEEKVQMWLAHGASLVWVVHPATRTATIYRRDGSANVLHNDDLLDGEAVLPGFAFSVDRLFL